jgi:siroheme synthase
VVSQATCAQQQVRWSNIAALASEALLPAPSILLVGRVATPSFVEWGAGINPEVFQSTETSELHVARRNKN